MSRMSPWPKPGSGSYRETNGSRRCLMTVDEKQISSLVRRIIEEVKARERKLEAGVGGIYPDLDEAIAAAQTAQEQLSSLSLEKRGQLIQRMREAAMAHSPVLAEMAVRETGMGRVQDKIAKNRLAATKTPGVEDLTTDAWSGDHGLTIVEMAPFGVIGAITPSTNPAATVINNAIGMIAAGNSVVFNPHPSAKVTCCRTIEILNQAILEAGGPANLLTSVGTPDVTTAQALMRDRRIALLVATGGPVVVSAALSSGKKAVGAGAGNPPVVVDETADLAKAARDVTLGASLDNNLPCIAEKEIIAVDAVCDRLIVGMIKNGAVLLKDREVDDLCRVILTENEAEKAGSCSRVDAHRRFGVQKRFIGKSASFILTEAGLQVSGDPRVIICEVDRCHPLVVHEQLMPVLPLVRVADVDEAIRLAVEVEGRNRHTAVMFSRNVDHMTALARAIKTTVFVKNGPSYAGIGLGGEGFTTFTIAGPTGEGLTSARTFTRRRRCTLVDAFSIV